MRKPTETDPWAQPHFDIGALAERVKGTETSLVTLGDKIETVSRDMATQISSLSNVMAAQIRDLSLDIRRQQEASLNAGRTNWAGFWQIVFGAIALVMSLVAAILFPVFSEMSRHDAAIELARATQFSRTDAASAQAATTREFDKIDGWLGTTRDRLRFDEDNAVSQRQLVELKERLDERYKITSDFTTAQIARLDKQFDALSAKSVTSAEVESSAARTDARFAAVIAGMDQLRHEFGANFTLGDAVKEIQRQLSELRTVAPPAPSPGRLAD